MKEYIDNGRVMSHGEEGKGEDEQQGRSQEERVRKEEDGKVVSQWLEDLCETLRKAW